MGQENFYKCMREYYGLVRPAGVPSTLFLLLFLVLNPARRKLVSTNRTLIIQIGRCGAQLAEPGT
jgi:hypothetical protein